MKPTKQNQYARAFSRRDFVKINALAGAGLLVPSLAKANHEKTIKYLPKLSGATIPKYVQPLIVPGAMPEAAPNYYELAIRQFYQQILPPGYPATRVAGFGAIGFPNTFLTPALPIVTQANAAVRIKWINGQTAANGNFLPHVLADELFPDHVMWANPPGPRDHHGMTFMHNPYKGPVPIVTHLHGGASRQESDGHPMAWYLPNANNIPPTFFTEGTHYDEFDGLYGSPWDPGSATFEYSGNDVATMLWCHDHTLGITEYNVYAGFAGGYLVTGGAYDLPAGALPEGAYHIPLVIQDRSFRPDGSLLFHASEEGGNGDTMMVNGRTWPYLDVEQRRYRFRILNGCNNRNIKLRFSSSVPTWIIGGDLGFIPSPVQVTSLPLTNAERADVIVDFSRIPVGTILYLQNKGGDAKKDTTGQVMKLRVVARTSADTSTPPDQLGSLPVKQLQNNSVLTRKLAILDERQGIIDAGGNPVSLEFEDPATEIVQAGSTEIWELYGYDSHPIHLHAMKFQILNREDFGGSVQAPKSWEKGLKDTVDINENGITRLKVQFDDHPGRFVWHCHILRHEDMGMMRPLELL